MVGERIRLARLAKHMSLRELANLVGVSYEAIRKYENNKSTPSTKVLLRLAQALECPVDFFRPAEVSIGKIQPVYRAHAKRTKRMEKAVEAQIQNWLERYLTIERILGRECYFEYPLGFPRAVKSFDEIEQAAIDLRTAWELGLAPIANLTALLEDKGIRVGVIEGCDGIDACAFFAQNETTLPVIVCARDVPGDRQRFSLAHELAHILLRVEEQSDEESFAHRFAGAFLVPAPVAKSELQPIRRARSGERYELTLSGLEWLKQEYGMSMQAWIRRAYDLGIIHQETYQRINREFRIRGWHRREPGPTVQYERPLRFQYMVLEAYEREYITASRASQLLALSLQEFLDLYAQTRTTEIVAVGGG